MKVMASIKILTPGIALYGVGPATVLAHNPLRTIEDTLKPLQPTTDFGFLQRTILIVIVFQHVRDELGHALACLRSLDAGMLQYLVPNG